MTFVVYLGNVLLNFLLSVLARLLRVAATLPYKDIKWQKISHKYTQYPIIRNGLIRNTSEI